MSMMLMFDNLPDEAFLRQYHLVKARRDTPGFTILPFSPATLWRKVKDGTFPAPVKMAGNITAWKTGDVRRWLQAQGAVEGPR